MRKVDKKSNISGEIIKNARKSQKLTQDKLAAELQLLGLSVDKSFISKVETEKRILREFEFLAIAQVLEIDLNELRDNLKLQEKDVI